MDEEIVNFKRAVLHNREEDIEILKSKLIEYLKEDPNEDSVKEILPLLIQFAPDEYNIGLISEFIPLVTEPWPLFVILSNCIKSYQNPFSIIIILFEFESQFGLHMDNYFHYLTKTISLSNLEKEQYRLFLLNSLVHIDLLKKDIFRMIRTLCRHITQLSTPNCAHLLNILIIICRMVPECYKELHKCKRLYLLLESEEIIASLAFRLFADANNSRIKK